MRLNKYLSEMGVCSRRKADKLIEEGRVLVDGKRGMVGMQVLEGQNVVVDGVALEKKEEMVLLAVNKPRGVVCSNVSQGQDVNIVEYLGYPKKFRHAGRLETDSQAL